MTVKADYEDLVDPFAASDANSFGAAINAAYVKPGGGIPSTDLASAVQTSLGKADTAYQKPAPGIPSTDMTSAVTTSLGKADTAVQPGGALGTPSSGTLSGCSGLPVSGITASTSTALGVGSVELGHATDTTLSRSSAGVLAVEGTAVLLNGGALGTPTSGTLSGCSGLPITGITDSTSEALGVGTLELGHATDTTLSRSSAGVLAVEGTAVLLNGGALGTPASGVATNLTGQVADLSIVAFAASTTRAASSYGDFPMGIKLQRAITFTSVTFRAYTADASGNLVVELRKNGSQVSGTSTTIAAANQVAGGTSTGSWAFAAGDIITVYVTGVGTTPGKGLIADVKGSTT